MVIFKTRYRANKISIHAPAKGATIMGFKRAIDSPYFNPRSREGSDYNSRYCYCVANISIHAPAKGATVPHLSEHYRIAISIHAPAKGATRGRRSQPAPFCISIHAPAKGATVKEPNIYIKVLRFQSTLPRRERLAAGVRNTPYMGISIHAPAKGATAFINIFSLTVRLFLFHLTNKI